MNSRRQIVIQGEVAIVPLTQGFVATIDREDIHLIDGHLWAALRRGSKWYAGRSIWRSGTNDVQLMHRVILAAKTGELIDHRDGNGLLNRRFNLRLATQSQNAMNSGPHSNSKSGVKGVHWSKQHGRWKAEICSNGIRTHLGLFDQLEEAAAVYNSACLDLHGEFAKLSAHAST